MKPNNANGNRKPKIYLAGPLFSDAETTFNEMVAQFLEEWVDVYLPQRDGGLMSDMVSSGISADVAARSVFQGDINAIHEADYLIAILDGRAIDEGVALELGVAYTLSKRCVGIQTDSRRLASWGNNPMIAGALEHVFHSVEDLLSWIRRELLEAGVSYPLRTTAELEVNELN